MLGLDKDLDFSKNKTEVFSEEIIAADKEKRGFFGAIIDDAAQIIAKNPKIVRSVIGVASTIIGAATGFPAVGAIGAVVSEATIAISSQINNKTIERRNSIKSQKSQNNEGKSLQQENSKPLSASRPKSAAIHQDHHTHHALDEAKRHPEIDHNHSDIYHTHHALDEKKRHLQHLTNRQNHDH